MFGRKKCHRCGEKISNKFTYCPNCGVLTGNEREDFGLLGRDDSIDEFDEMSKVMFGGVSGKMLNKMLSGAMKMLEKEMQRSMEQEGIRTNFELYVNGKKINPENIRVIKKPVQKQNEKKHHNSTHLDEESIKRFIELPKSEPKTNVRRFSNRVLYEVDMPGVESIKDISIVRLENSIEIKAVAKDKAYKKIIPIDLPLKQYKLDKDKLILELGVKG